MDRTRFPLLIKADRLDERFGEAELDCREGLASEARLERVIVGFGRPAAAGEPVAAAAKLRKAFRTTAVPATRKADGLFDADAGKVVLDRAQLACHEGAFFATARLGCDWEWLPISNPSSAISLISSQDMKLSWTSIPAMGHVAGCGSAELSEQGRDEVTVRRDCVVKRRYSRRSRRGATEDR